MVILDHIQKIFYRNTPNENQVLNNLSLKVEDGDFITVIGSNGAGKSTTMKMLTGYLKPNHGTIEICGKSISTAPLEIKRLIGYLPENTPLYNEMYIKEFLNLVISQGNSLLSIKTSIILLPSESAI